MDQIPHIIKYMGSKRNILEFVVESILDVKRDGNRRLYDLFGGSAVVSAAFRNIMPVTCNDIQSYTQVIAGTYLNNYFWDDVDSSVLEQIVLEASQKVETFKKKYPKFQYEYSANLTYEEVFELEENQRKLFDFSFEIEDHLFAKNYSGTYWSYDQCLWIDAISSVARSESYKGSFLYNIIMSSLMFSMAYCTQSTGHYAQYRTLTESNLNDILLYRQKSILPLFKQKFESLKLVYNGENNSQFDHKYTSKNYIDLLKELEEGSIVYADPPYQFVHYSRFYHALETLVKYDYPYIMHKGRYREDRHQSPFCIKTKVPNAFIKIFKKVNESRSTLVLSYSDTGMISLEEITDLAKSVFIDYTISYKEIDHKHSTMGRQKDKSRDVKEALIICQPN